MLCDLSALLAHRDTVPLTERVFASANAMLHERVLVRATASLHERQFSLSGVPAKAGYRASPPSQLIGRGYAWVGVGGENFPFLKFKPGHSRKMGLRWDADSQYHVAAFPLPRSQPMPRRTLPADKTPKRRTGEQPPDNDDKPKDEIPEEGLLAATGSKSLALGLALIERAINALWIPDKSDKEAVSKAMDLAVEALAELKPRDAAEGMLAAQMIASHEAAMECMRRAMLPNQTFEGRDQNLKHAAKMMSLYERQLAALDKRRGGGRQKITVEHVTVQAGGQAIVGDVHAEALAPPSPAARREPQQKPTLSDDSAASGDGEDLAKALAARPVKARSRKGG